MQHEEKPEDLTLVALGGEAHTRDATLEIEVRFHALGLGKLLRCSIVCLRTLSTDSASLRFPSVSLPLPNASTTSGSIRTSPPAVIIGTYSSSIGGPPLCPMPPPLAKYTTPPLAKVFVGRDIMRPNDGWGGFGMLPRLSAPIVPAPGTEA